MQESGSILCWKENDHLPFSRISISGKSFSIMSIDSTEQCQRQPLEPLRWMRRKLYPCPPSFLKNLHFQIFSLCIFSNYSWIEWKLIFTASWLLYTCWEIWSDLFLMHHFGTFCVSCLIKMGPQKNSMVFQILWSSNICFYVWCLQGLMSDVLQMWW